MSIVCFGMLPAQANAKYSGIVIDAKTGKTLYSYKADKARYPASLTKMMTMYMMFEALESGKLSKKTRIKVSRNAAAEVPSKLGIKAGRSIAAEHAIYALATKSANDVATAVAEHLGGSEAGFARMMTRKARKIGMSRTTFKNAHGLTAKGQLTTARDMARLGIALREHYPQYYKYFSTRNFKYGKANYRNHNRLLGQVKGVDGIKTGYTRASGFNLVSSVQASRRSIVAVVMGGRSGKSRNAQMRKLIATYLRKASKRKKKKMIAGVKSRSVFIASAKSVVLPKRGPVPEFRPGAVTVAAKTVDVSKPVQVAAIVPTAKVAANPAILRPAVDVTTTATVKPVVTRADVGSSAKPTGWVIQIAAADSRDKAVNLLEGARKRAPSLLGSKQIYTEPVKSGSATLHRARFAGFNGKNDARKACKILKKKKLSCLALNMG
jgi:D-alanyl-D-alanine carboxypeptidase